MDYQKIFQHGAVETFFRLRVFSATFLTLLPLVSDISLRVLSATVHHLHTRTNVFLQLAVIGCALLYRIPTTAAFSTLAIVVNASIDPSMRGTMKGLIMTAGSVRNGKGPVIGSTVYALALAIAYAGNSHHQQPYVLPIDGRIVFVLGGFMAIALAFFVRAKMKV
jgi:hypothetical protein